MNRCVKMGKCFVFLLAVFTLCLVNIAFAFENPAAIEPTEITPPPVRAELPLFPAASSSVNVKPTSIGCVLPLSGPYSDWGKKALDAIMLAAGVSFNKNRTVWEIVVEDSRSLPEKTKAAVEKLANAGNVMAIIAVTGKAEPLEAAAEANKWKVPLILITSAEDVTSAGEFVFQHFLTPGQQIRELVKYAVYDLNCGIFSVLYPQDDYGMEMEALFRREVARFGGKVERAISYRKNQTDFSGEIRKLKSGTTKPKSKTKPAKQDDPEAVPFGFEAIFIPDSYLRVKMITSQLDYHKVKGFALLGTSLWNSPHLRAGGAPYMENAVFVDSFFIDGGNPEIYDFVEAFYATHKRQPENIEALAFDTAGMIFSVLDNTRVKTRQDFVSRLAQTGIYHGVTGATYFDPGRVSQKTPFILRIQKEGLELIR
jgi:ABC-type branched-subunit amino acid transport system substrate-binding protein